METMIACMTAPGKAAIATLAVRGLDAWGMVCELFRPARGVLPAAPQRGQYWFGKLGAGQADDAILAVKEGLPAASLELHCHGGVAVVAMIQELFAARGAVVVPWQRFVDDSASLIDLLTHAPTARTAAILLDQVNGAWSRVTPADVPRLRELIPLGQHLVAPWRVVLAGAPNVGKSSLMNALAGYTRSVVAPTPGTTRDVVATRLAIDGWPVELTDTAGMRVADVELERVGIERAQDAVRNADLRIWVVDGSASPVFADDAHHWLIVINKTDLPAAWDWAAVPDALRVSARTQDGLADLCEIIARELVPRPPAPREAVPCLPEQVRWVESLAQPESDTKRAPR